MSKILDWIDDRTGYRGFLHALLLFNFRVGPAAHWRYVWGGSLALMFLLELITGTLLMTVYSPSEAAAWGSVHYIENNVQWGAFIRGLHHYTSHMMLVLAIVHTVLVVLTAAYRKPREFTYWTGLLLGGLVLALAVSGNPLPWDQKGYWAYQIETGIAGTMPVIGSSLEALLIGGSEFGNLTLTRLYTLHVIVLPAAAFVLLLIHMALLRREKIKLGLTVEDVDEDETIDAATGDHLEPYWPYQTARNLIVFCIVMGAVVAQMVYYPSVKERHLADSPGDWEADIPLTEVSLEAPADPNIPYNARPEWYVRTMFELRHMVDKEQEPLITAGLPVLIIVLLFLMPFYEKVLGRQVGHAVAILLIVGGLAGAMVVSARGIRRERDDEAIQATRRQEIDYAGRAIWLARESGIPPEGPVTLLHNDAKAMGPLLFKAHCAMCHTWNGHDGTGVVVEEPTAGDMAGFGSVEWITEFLINPQSPKFFGHINETEDIREGEMSRWVDDYTGEEGPITERELRDVARLLAREAGRPDNPKASEEQIERGIALFTGGDLLDAAGETIEIDERCLDCHGLSSVDPDEETGASAIDLTGYGSRDWLKDFIREPGNEERFYGLSQNNIMPGFDATQISEHDLDLLVGWMRGEWARPKDGKNGNNGKQKTAREKPKPEEAIEGPEQE